MSQLCQTQRQRPYVALAESLQYLWVARRPFSLLVVLLRLSPKLIMGILSAHLIRMNEESCVSGVALDRESRRLPLKAMAPAPDVSKN